MTLAILAWQALIFITILLAGRHRGWVTAFWVVWTAVQVVALPLSVLQFCTIVAAFLLARSRAPAMSTDQPARNTKPAQTSIAPPSKHASSQDDRALKPTPINQHVPEPGSLLASVAAWSDDLNRKTNDWAETEQIKRQAKEQIKTDNFASEKEEKLMKEALARDQALSHEIQQELAKDEVLAELYQGYLQEYSKSPKTVWERQLHEEMALKAARGELDLLKLMVEKGPRFVKTFLRLRKVLDDDDGSSAGERGSLMLSEDLDENPVVFGRNLNDWMAKFKETRSK